MKINLKIISIILGRSLITISLLLSARIGTFLPIPGINHKDLAFYVQTHSLSKTLITTFLGDETVIIGLFVLNVFPYINASILVQFLIATSSRLMEEMKDGGLESRRRINQLTRFIAIISAIIQSIVLVLYLRQILFNWNYILAFKIIIWLTTGGMIILWFAEIITEYGLGNGISLFVSINIVSSFPSLIKKIVIESSITFSGIAVFVLALISLYGVIFIQKGTRMVELISLKELTDNSEIAKNQNYLPLRFNVAGVMPIILASSILIVPNYFISLVVSSKFNSFGSSLILGPFYWVIFFILILVLSIFYSKIIINPQDVSKNLQSRAVTIPRIRPGRSTIFYLQQTMNRVTLIGSTILAILVTLPNFFGYILNITNLNGLSVTSLLILQGVLIELEREIKDIQYSNIY